MSTDLNLKKSLYTVVYSLVGIYLLICLVVVSIAVYSSHVHHERLAEALGLAVRNSLVIRDLRQVISTLNPAIGSSFTAITFSTARGESIINLSSTSEAEEAGCSLLERRIDVPIASASSELERGEAIGVLRFTYSMIVPVGIAIGFWALFLAMVVPVFNRIRVFIERRHGEILKAREAELLASIAQQVSHDIRSPLSALNMVVKGLDGIPETERSIIQTASTSINGIANDLLQRHRSKIHSSAVSVDGLAPVHIMTKPVKIAELLKAVHAEKTAVFAGHAGVSIKLNISGPVEAVCEIDEKELLRALSNLINNAVEALRGRGGSVTLAFRSSLKDVAVLVSDDGQGIPEEVLMKLGKERVTHGKEGTESGLGIGVLHAQSVVEAMGGKLSIQSRVGMGTIVTITLPRCDLERTIRSSL